MAAAGRAQAARDRVPRIDPYGFERPEDFDYAAYEEFFSTYLVILTRRAIKWSKLLKGGGGVQRSMTVKRYIRKGVPLEHRARVWMGVSGAQAQMDRNPGYYQRLLQGERSASLEEAIRTGSHKCRVLRKTGSLCPLYTRSPPALAPPSAPCLYMSRTFPDNVRFRKDAEPCLQGPLYNVLLAYGCHNHGVGYCQGMNFIAGYLILVTKSEEEAFWLLDALVGRILPGVVWAFEELQGAKPKSLAATAAEKQSLDAVPLKYSKTGLASKTKGNLQVHKRTRNSGSS
ncbi:growth hormone-regulated TBC protein 1 isoform X12 [Odocoileus virginianus]|uniref:Growth hormone-regulated TBC protein 1 isoform X12 n=1 Tax=Odocoileus virginianus TaxID=9874 RepID=A0ABM4II30_ODOVR